MDKDYASNVTSSTLPASAPELGRQACAELTEASLLRIADWVEDSITDGPGLRFTLFTQGCPHACPGCHNPQTHAYEGGRLVTVETVLNKIRANPLLDGVTLSGGDPFEQPEVLAYLAEKVHELGLSVMTYTGYTYERLSSPIGAERGWHRLLEQTDLLVDGRFMAQLRDPLLLFRGSSNQRILNVAESRRVGHAVSADLVRCQP
ncbi:anaerobic ribonucleoside-triphosphate reductase activating protein [Gorillibacterium timonense]|uniref:anaerobic ribonucleoside-triphosphate reductase activating protein n=1 Tax=Gorillibacterium timonense TaxID=1689269 RepID=UPI0009E97384|nr:anaerobic ribonucleoside-triphosphate reductase activating protein [Gorillibacterium timonense]